MAKVTAGDYLDILDLVYRINYCEDIDSFISTLLPSLIRLFRSECATFHLIKGDPVHIKIVESRACKSENNNLNEDKYYPALYKSNFFQHSPLLKAAVSSSKNIFKTGESISLREWEKSDLYNDFILPQHLYWELFISLRWKKNLEGMITLWRSRQQKEYQDDEIAKTELLAPHLNNAVHNIRMLSKIYRSKKALISDQGCYDNGVLLLDHRLKPSFFNDKARDICLNLSGAELNSSYDLDPEHFPLPPVIVKDCSDLINMLKVNDQPALFPKERIVFIDCDRRYHTECSLIWKSNDIQSKPNFLITISDMNDRNMEISLKNNFHLSSREIDIAYCIIAGLSYSEISEKLCISKLTVHTHVKNLYRKTRAKNRIELEKYIQSTNN